MRGQNSKEGLLDSIEKTAHDYEKSYHGCSRCVLRAIHEHMKETGSGLNIQQG